jgi:hypothetical protein
MFLSEPGQVKLPPPPWGQQKFMKGSDLFKPDSISGEDTDTEVHEGAFSQC